MPKLICPHCERELPASSVPGPVTCEGCEARFDPAKVYLEPATPRRRLAGWALDILGCLLLVRAARAAYESDLEGRERIIDLLLSLVVPIVLLSVGLNLRRARRVAGDALRDAD